MQPLLELKPTCVLGEGPIYRDSDHSLHFNDCGANKTHIVWLDPVTNEVNPNKAPVTLKTADSVSAQYFRKDHPGSYIVLYYQGIALMDEKTGALQVLKEIIPTEDREKRRLNDGCIDPRGRFWAGEIDKEIAEHGVGFKAPRKPIGRLWRYDPDGSLHEMDTGLVCSNGIGWSPDLKSMYLNDSTGQKTFVYDYDVETGEISKRRIIREYTGTSLEPDGLVVDTDGNIWSAMWGGSCVTVLSPKGEILKEIKFPASKITCPSWGGENRNILYVTSAFTEGEALSGQVFKYVTEKKGMPQFDFAG